MKTNNIKKKWVCVLLAVIVIATAGTLFVHYRQTIKEQYQPYTQFLTCLDNGEVESIKYNASAEKITYTLINGEKHNTDNPKTETFKEDLLLSGVKKVDETEISKSKLEVELNVEQEIFN